jgi:hypothetical protein
LKSICSDLIVEQSRAKTRLVMAAEYGHTTSFLEA